MAAVDAFSKISSAAAFHCMLGLTGSTGQTPKFMALRLCILGIFLVAMTTQAAADVKDAAAREALFEEIVDLTMAREAWSPYKNKVNGVSYPDAFEPFREEFIAAETDEELFYAITRLSNARFDSHLSVTPIEGGLAIESGPAVVAPIRLMFDFSKREPTLFVADFGVDLSDIEGGKQLSVGDRVLTINGVAAADYVSNARLYYQASTDGSFKMRFARSANAKSSLLPSTFYRDRFDLVLKSRRGRKYSVSAPYKEQADVEFRGIGEQRYPGFERVLDFTSFDFYRATDDRKIVVFDWYGFRDDVVEAMDAVMVYAKREELLDHDVIWDGTQSRGGGRGAYAIQRLQPKPFKTTFGNVRISDVIPLFIAERKEQFDRRQTMSDGSPELVGDPAWLMDWLLDDVTKGIEAEQVYSNDVPFKLAHAPKYSDGILYPADTHFRGRMVCWLSPRGGSHLDQFAAIVADNNLCPILGMPAGGYSNTWEWEETLTWPGTDEPVVGYMWNIGHTIRPNGQVLEGNPADVDEFIPITAENYTDYYDILLNKTLEILSDDRDQR